MGLSLRNIGKDIGGFLSGAAHVAEGVERQINPFDNGATYSNPNPAPRPTAPAAAPLQSAGFNPNFQGPQMGPPPQFGQQDSSNPFSNPLVTAKPKQQNVTQSQSNAPAAGDVPGLKKALQGIGSYSSDDQARIVNRASQAGLIPGNVAAAMQNQILSPTLSTDRSKLGELAQAASTSLLPGASNLAKQVGTNLASQNLLNQSLNGQYNPGIVNNTLNQANAENGGIVDNLKGISAPHLAGQTIQGAVALGTLGLGGEAAQGISKVPTLLNTAKASAKLGVGLGVPGGVAQTLSGDNYSPGEFAKNIATNTAQMAALPAVAGGLPIVTARLAETAGKPAIRAAQTAVDNRVPLNAIGAVGKDVNPTPEELNMGKALGMTPNDVAQAKTDMQLSPAEKGQLPSGQQMSLAELERQSAPLAPKEVNTAKNPFQADIPEVGHNNFSQVISNEQVASEIGKDNVLHSLNNLRKSSPEEYQNFWEYANGDPGFKEAPKSPELQKALDAWRTADNRIHGNSQALGGNTNYLQDHGLHPVVFNEDMTSQLLNGADPNKFPGLNNFSRKHATMADLRAAAERGGFQVGNDPLSEASHYLNASEAALRRRAIIKGVGEADGANPEKPHTLVLGAGDKNRVDISQQAHDELRGLQRSIPTNNKLVKGARTANVATKSTLLSFGQFHPNNISLARAAPTLAIPKPSTVVFRNKTTGKLGIDPTMSSHPVKAIKGLYATYRPLVPGSGTEFAAKVNARAVKDGMDLKAARIGAPYNAQLYDASGSSIAGVGHKLLGRQMLGMHDQAVRAVIGDLEKRGIPLNSDEARVAGKAVNNMMGFVNDEAQKIPPAVSRGLSDMLLARQFTHSKFSQLRTGATNAGVGGAYARANVAANVVASTAIIAGVGYILNQKSDNIRDSLIRALTDPAIPTPMKDSKGNTVKLRLPGTDASDLSKLLGIKQVRQPDGHLGISWKPSNMPSTVEDFARARLSPLASIPVKLATNENYAGKPLFDPNAPLGTKAEQAATVLGTGLLPIGAQGLPMVSAVEKHLPGNIQDVLNANKPGGNPLVKSLASSFGVTPTTDATVGKGLQSSQYFSALDAAKSGLNAKEKDALDLYAGSKKNPVTGKYDVQPNVNDTVTKARALLDQPKVIDNLIAMNNKLASQGQKVDPLWQASKDQITKVLQYQSMPPGGADRTHWEAQNGSWYQPLSDQRTAFFNSLPKGDPNKPQAPIQYPDASPDVAALQKQFFDITDTKERAHFLQDHPEVQTQLDAQIDYNNKMREAQGYSALDKFPAASPDVQKIISEYNALPQHDGSKGGNKSRSLWITAHPDAYKAMSDYYTQASLYGLSREAGQAQFADTGASQKLLKDAYNLGKYDIVKNSDGSYSLGSSYSSSSGGSSSGGGKKYYSRSSSGGGSGVGGGAYVSRTAAELANPYFDAIDIDAGGKKNIGKAQKPKVSKTVSFKPKVTGFKPKAATANLPAAVAPTKLKANLKKSKV